MTFAAPDGVASGRAYVVRTVDGQEPSALTQFVDATEFTVEVADSGSVIRGVGSIRDDQVRFHEKAIDVGGKDVRVWDITQDGDRFVATPATSF
jgi:hypothetical protein